MSAALEIRAVTRRFGKNTAVNGIDFVIPEGQMVGIFGRSGAGKSTFRLALPAQRQVVMDALRDINKREGLTVITNLQTLDTARADSDRIIGMTAGKVLFDGSPDELDRHAVRMVYDADSSGDLSEAIISTSIARSRIPASGGSLEPALS